MAELRLSDGCEIAIPDATRSRWLDSALRSVDELELDYLAGTQTCPTSTPSQKTKTTNADGSSSRRPRTREIEASAPAARMITMS